MSLIPDFPKPTLAGTKIALNQLIKPRVDGLLPEYGTWPIEKLAKYFEENSYSGSGAPTPKAVLETGCLREATLTTSPGRFRSARASAQRPPGRSKTSRRRRCQ